MKYFKLEPEVAGELGPNSELNTRVHPPIVSKLNYEFAGCPEDSILSTFPCFIVTERARQELLAIGATGMYFDSVEITISPEFDELYPDCDLPDFVWLKVDGVPGKNDFGLKLEPVLRLVISERVLQVFSKLGLSQGIITPFEM